MQFGSEHLRLVQSTEEVVASGMLAKTLGCPQGTHWLRISSLRIDADKESRPVGWTDVYIDPAYTGGGRGRARATGRADQFARSKRATDGASPRYSRT